MAAIEAHDLSKRYRRTWALRHIDAAIPEGSITALVGPNGAGKSTLLKACIAFERPTNGSVLVLGVNPWRERGRALALVGYVPQVPTLYRDLSVAGHLDLAASLRAGFDRSGALERLADLAIPAGATPAELSGGQQAQVWLAIALGTRAPVLLLDEPLANLDPLARREFLAVLVDAVRHGGLTAVISSHVITEAEEVCDRLLVLGTGRVLFHDTVAAAMAAHSVLDGDQMARDRVASFPERGGGTATLVRVRGGGRDAADGHGAGRPPTLEEVVIGYLASDRSAASSNPSRVTTRRRRRAAGHGGGAMTRLGALLTLRLHRFEFVTCAGLGAAVIAALAYAVWRMSLIHVPIACFRGPCDTPEGVLNKFFNVAGGLGVVLGGPVLLPAVSGLVLGVALVGKEIERGTAVLAWSVGTSRRRWLAERLLPAVVLLLVSCLAAGALADVLEGLRNPVVDPAASFEHLGLRGILPAAHGIAAFGLALLVGAWLGRLLPALLIAGALSLATVIGVRAVTDAMLNREVVVLVGTRDSDLNALASTGLNRGVAFLQPDGQLLTYEEARARYGQEPWDDNGIVRPPLREAWLLTPGSSTRWTWPVRQSCWVGSGWRRSSCPSRSSIDGDPVEGVIERPCRRAAVGPRSGSRLETAGRPDDAPALSPPRLGPGRPPGLLRVGRLPLPILRPRFGEPTPRRRPRDASVSTRTSPRHRRRSSSPWTPARWQADRHSRRSRSSPRQPHPSARLSTRQPIRRPELLLRDPVQTIEELVPADA